MTREEFCKKLDLEDYEYEDFISNNDVDIERIIDIVWSFYDVEDFACYLFKNTFGTSLYADLFDYIDYERWIEDCIEDDEHYYMLEDGRIIEVEI